MNNNHATAVIWRRLRYMLSPQLDIYAHLAGRLAGKRVLEVGFGTGVGTLQYAGVANGVVAIDPDEEAVAFAKSTFPVRGVTWECADILNYRPNGRCQAVVVVEVLEHIPEWERALLKIYDLLLPGDHLYLSHKNANADLRKNDLHEREWTAAQLSESVSRVFGDVWLYDYTLTHVQGPDTRMTPLVAVARR